MLVGSAMAARAGGPGDGRQAPIVYVTGKGGTGKTTVSTMIARRAAERGLSVALVATGARATATARTRDDRERFSIFQLDERAALGQLVARLLRVRFLAGRLMDSRSFSAVAAAAPGVRELVYMSYIRDVARSRVGGVPLDLVVVDGFATGHTIAMLSSPYTTADMIPLGPAARIARAIGRMTSSAERFRVLAVTLPEELPATECGELGRRLAELGIAVAATVVNAAYPAVLTDTQLEWLNDAAAGAKSHSSLDALLYEARRRRQAEIVAAIEAQGATTITLPYSFDGGGKACADVLDSILLHCVEARR